MHAIWYDNLFELGFDNTGNQSIFAWDTASPITLLDPTFNVRGVTAVFTGWSFSGYTNGTKLATWEGSKIPTPFPKESPMYKRRNVVATANFDIPQVTYLDFEGGTLSEQTDECELVKTDTTTLEAGKVYAVLGNVTIEKRITVNGTSANPTKLVLCDGATLAVTKGVEVAAGKALVICGQALGSGTLEATGVESCAGIGGGGDVTINGGTVIATGGSSAAGIGGGTVTINGISPERSESPIGDGYQGCTVTAAGRDGAAGIAGTVKFGANYAYGVAAGADEASALYKTAAAYAADPSAAYVALPCFALKIPEKEGCSYAVSYEGAQPKATLADKVNTYAIAAGATVRVRFMPGEDYVWEKAPEDNPMLIKGFANDAVIDAGDLPTVKFMKKGSAGNPWTVGAGVTAYIDENGTLHVEGEGAMKDFDPSSDPAPWGTGVTEAEIGEGVTSVGANAFLTCIGLTSVTIPASVTSIGAAAFFGSTSLSNVVVEAMTPPALGADALAGTAKDLKICVPLGTGAAYKAAPGWSAYADRIFEPAVVAQFVKGGEVVAEFATAADAVAALDDAQYADIEEFRIGLVADTEFDFGGRTNRVVILNVGAGTNTLKNVLLDCAGDYVVTGMVGTVVFGEGVRIEKDLDFKRGLVKLIIKDGLYKNVPSGYCEEGYFGARRYDENKHLNGLYAILPEAAIAVTVSKGYVTTHYATLQDAFNLIGKDEDVTLRLFNNLELGTAVTKLEDNKVIHLLPSEAGANTITRVGAEPVIEIGRGAKLEIKNVIFDGANVTSEKPMIEVAGKTGTNYGWLIAGDGFVVSNAVGGAVHVGSGGKFELNGVAKIIENTTGGKPKNVIIEDSAAIQLTACGAVTDGNYAQIGVWSETAKFMVAGGQFGTVNTSYEYATDFADGDISVAKPWVGFINDLDGSLHHAAGAKIAAAGKKTYKRWVGGEYKELVEEGDYLISRESKFPSSPTYLPELIWTARQEAPAAEPAPAVLDWTDTTITLAVSNGCDYAVVTDGMAETNWISMVRTDNTYKFARPAGDDYLCLRRYSITSSNIVSAATAYSVRVAAGTEGDPWLVGEGMFAWTNGTEFVVGGAGTVPDLAKLASKVTAQKLTIKDATVTGAEDDAFAGFGNVSLMLPDGWQGDLPDEEGNWYGAAGVTLSAVPLSVRNVRSQQRYPWNGLVDVGFTLTGPDGETNVVITVRDGATEVTNFTAAVTIPEGVLATNLVWDAEAAGLGDDFTSDDITIEVAFAAASAISAKSEAGWLDLTVGDRIAKDVETLVVDPAWGNASEATVELQNGWLRTYTCASNDLWDTTTLTPGRYTLALSAGAAEYTAAFWKTGDDWVVFDSSNITADVTFEAGKTYLFFGTNTVDATLTLTDGAKFEYAPGAGFLGGTVAELPKRYEQKTVCDLYQIVEKAKGCADNPWEVGEGVEAYTNGTELVIGGEGAMKDFSDADPAPWGTSVTSVTLGEGVTGIGAGAFKGCASITKVTTDAVVPPAADTPVFGSSVPTEVHVPADAGEAYRSATGWSDYKELIKEVPGCAERPWTLGEGVTAWVDEALTNLAAVVIDNGLPAATNAISLVALTNAFDRGGYEPAKCPLNALLKIDETDKATYVKPVSWFDANNLKGETYETLEAALAAGVTAVVPNFEKGAEIPQEIVETEQGEDGKTYTAVVENVSTNEVVNPIKVIAAEGLTSMATNEQKNARLVVEPKDKSDVEPGVVEGLTNKLFMAEDNVDVRSPNFVDLSVFYDKVQTNELESPIAIHIPWKVRGYATYRVARWHDGSSQEILEGNTGDGEYFEKGEDEIILHVKNFSHYALGESYLLPGSPRNPWPLGEGVTAVTNGSALVIGGEGTISSLANADGLAELLSDLTAITITSNGVTEVAANVFQGVRTDDAPVLLTLPDGWQGELPGEGGNWYGAMIDMDNFVVPLAVKKVKFAQRYPWNGLVDVGFTLTGPVGETNVVVTVKDGATEVTNFTETVTIPAGGVLSTNLVWDAATADLVDDFKGDDVTVEVKIAASNIAAKSAVGTVDLRTNVALAEGETTVSIVTWSATAWGAVPGATSTGLGYTNKTTGASGVIAEGLVGENWDNDVPLPQKDGEYVLTHSTGDLTSFVKFTVSGYPLGGEGNPWEIGADDLTSVTAYTNGVGALVISGAGAMTDFTAGAPWDDVATNIKVVDIGADITKLGDGAFGALTGVESNILESADTPINPAAFADSEGQIANEPKFYVRNEDGGLDEVLEFTLEDGTVYDTLAEALDDEAEAVFGVTLPLAKKQAIEALTDLAYGENRDEPMSEAVTNALTAAISEINAATTLDEVGDAAEAGEISILSLACQERDMPIGESELVWRMVIDGAKTNLVIKGEGSMPNFDGEDGELDAPWDSVSGMLTGLVLSNGVESVGNEAFMLCENLESLYYEDMELPLNLHAFIGEYYDEDELVAATNLPTAVTVLVGEEVREPNGWRGDDGVVYDTLLEALEAGCTTVHVIVGAYVEFNAMGGVLTNGLEVLTNFFVTAYALPPVPERTDYEFLGWYDGWTNGAAVVTNDQPLLRYEPHTLYAKWQSTKFEPSETEVVRTDGSGTILRPTNSVPAELILPETDTGAADGTPLTKIDAKAFVAITNVTKVALPLYVTEIGARAFYNAENLGEVVFVQPRDFDTLDKVQLAIGERAFAGTKITAVTIPSATVSLGKAAFAGCANLASVTFLGAPEIDGDYPFRDCGTAVGGLKIKLSPRAAQDAEFIQKLTNCCNNVVIDPLYAGEVDATGIDVISEPGKVLISFTYSADDVDINVDTVSAVPGDYGEPFTAQEAMIPLEVRDNGITADGLKSYTAVFEKPAGSGASLFRIAVNIEK